MWYSDYLVQLYGGILFVILVKCLVVTDLDPNTVLRVPMLESRDNLNDNRDLKMAKVSPSLVVAHLFGDFYFS